VERANHFENRDLRQGSFGVRCCGTAAGSGYLGAPATECLSPCKRSQTCARLTPESSLLFAGHAQEPKAVGPDASEFNPGRFAHGISKAALNPGAFLPFSLGPRSCVGQNFALAEAKVILGALLIR